jgi:hypothetical protein
MKNSKTNIMNMVSNKVLTVFIAAAIMMGSCDDFGNINTDPNNPSVAKTELLFTNAQTSVSDVVGAFTGTLYVQYFAETQYNEDSRYQTPSFDYTGWYTGPLKDLNTIIDLNTDPATAEDVQTGGSNANQIAAARIMKVYFFQMIADRWGVVPYTEALQGSENFRPAFDSQETIYTDLISELSSATDQIGNGTGVTGDIFFGGDMNEWKKFANSLRMRLALRLADVAPSAAKSAFEDAYSDGMITNDIFYPYLNESANQNPWFERFITRTDYGISATIADTMKALQDRRVLAFADPAQNADNADGTTQFNEVIGLEYGASEPGDIPNATISFPGQAVRAQDAPLPIITLAELHLALAEAAQRGWSVGGTAESHYVAGIQASWNQWGMTDVANQTAYVNQPGVSYDANNWEALIGFQKWVALFPNGYEGWSEWRRLDYPALEVHPDAFNSLTEIPTSHGYPTSAATLNEENYNAAVSTRGGDGLSVKLWWDAN